MTVSPLAEITPNRYDWAVLEAVSYLRTALLNEPTVIDHLVDLAKLRDDAGFPYQRALDDTLLGEWFDRSEIDYMAETVREQLAHGWWGLIVSVDPRGRGYGRTKQRARAMAPETIELGVQDFVRRLSGHSSPHLDALTEHKGGASPRLRQIRRRVRQLPTL